MPTDDIESALEAVRFFADSANSVRVFEALADGTTTSRGLAERTGASRSTVARILDEGESRGWVDSEGSHYELTAVGTTVFEEFRDYMRTLDGVQNLGEAVDWLPPPVHALDFRHLRDADVVTPTRPTPSEPYDYVAKKIRETNRLRSLVELSVRRYARIIDERSGEDRFDAEVVMQADWFETLTADHDQLPLYRARAERGSVWAYDGEVPLNVHLFDETVAVWLGEQLGDERVVRGLLVTENPAVASWAESLYEEYRAESERLDPSALPTER